MLREASQQCPGPASPFVTVSFKDGGKEHEISKSQYIFSFIFTKEMDLESTPDRVVVQPQTPGKERNMGKTLI